MLLPFVITDGLLLDVALHDCWLQNLLRWSHACLWRLLGVVLGFVIEALAVLVQAVQASVRVELRLRLRDQMWLGSSILRRQTH